jgi:hypothetical protein
MANATNETVGGFDRHDEVKNLLGTGSEATSPASATYSRSTAVTGFSQFEWIQIVATIQGATGGTLDIAIETSADGSTWLELCRFVQLAAGATAATYTVDPTPDGIITARGRNLTTTFVLAAGSCVGGMWLDQMRVRMVAGSGTSAGAAQAISVIGLRQGR